MSRSLLARTLFAVGTLIAGAAAAAVPATPVAAAGGDVFAEGTAWCASTYPGHGTLSGFGPALDMGSPDDFRWPLHAPGDGTVTIHSEGWGGGWGNSIIWTRADGAEKIHMAHLDSIEKTGKVSAGDLIGRLGDTGHSTSPHLHASAQMNGQPAPLFLMGREIVAGGCYVSTGPIPPLCLGEQATIIGTAGDDALEGTKGPDVILGKGGDDTIDGRGGDDVICGGKGQDLLIGKGGADRIQGGPDADTLRGGVGKDLLQGAKGSDRLVGGAHRDKLIGHAGGDRLVAGKGPDRLLGGPGKDVLRGGPGRDTASYKNAGGAVVVDLEKGTASGEGGDSLATIERVRGSTFPDELVGDPGGNNLYGDKGNDTLDGNGGDDVVDGGQGVDTCTGATVLNCESSP